MATASLQSCPGAYEVYKREASRLREGAWDGYGGLRYPPFPQWQVPFGAASVHGTGVLVVTILRYVHAACENHSRQPLFLEPSDTPTTVAGAIFSSLFGAVLCRLYI